MPAAPAGKGPLREQPDHAGAQPPARRARQAPAPHRGALRTGHLRGHRRPRPQEAHAGGLRPGEPGAAAPGLRARRLRPAGLGEPGLRAGRLRGGAQPRPHAVPRVGVAPARRGLPVRPRGLRRRRRLRPAGRAPSTTSTGCAARAATTPSTCRSRRSSSPRSPSSWPARACRPRTATSGGGSSSRSRSVTTSSRRASSTTSSNRSSRPTRSSGSTTTSARRRSRTCWRCGSPTRCSSPSGTRTTSTTCRSPWRRTSASAAGPGYYDGIGAARDVIQNHLLQLLALTAMEEPVSFDAKDLRGEKEKVLSAVRLPEDLAAHTARGQYAKGWQGSQPVTGYLRGGGHLRRLEDRDVRRGQARHRHPPLGRRPVLPADRQAAGAARHRDRRRVQAGAAPAVRADGHRGARPERDRHPGPARRGRHHPVRLEGPGHADGGPRRHDGLRLRQRVHRGVARRPTSG